MKKENYMRMLVIGLSLLFFIPVVNAQHSVAREWNELLLHAIRNDFARPTVHARNLFHVSFAMYDSWAVYDDVAETYFLDKDVRGYYCPFDGIPTPADVQAAREETLSYAVFRLLNYRFNSSPGGAGTLNLFNDYFVDSLGYDPNNFSTNYASGDPAALGNYLASQIITFGQQDGSFELDEYENQFYEPVNEPLVTNFEGNPSITDFNRWQPLTLDVFIDQAGNPLPFDTPDFLSPEWGQVVPFSMKNEDLTLYQRNGDVYWTYHDPGPPPMLDTTVASGMEDEYKWNFSLVSIWSSHLDPESPNDVQWDISPGSIGNIAVDQYPTDHAGLRDFYNLYEGGDIGEGHDLNPVTGQPYAPQMVSRADYGRVLAEFWADGPDSETPPGHWFTLLNYVNDHPMFEKRFGGDGEILDDLEWDVKAYFILGGTMHDVAIASWGCKGWYDYLRPISAIRGMSELGQSSDENLPNYHPGGIPLVDGYIEMVDSADALAGMDYENVGKVKVLAWRGPDYIDDEETDFAGVDWILAGNWWPYQRPSFVTPPFAGYVSGHSTYSRAAAEVMTLLTGDAFFPGGMGEFNADQNEFLVFEDGPSTDLILQWATYRDASDQCSLSRIWGGIHPPADDIPGRLMGIEIGVDAFNYAETYFFTDEDQDGYFDFEDCDDLDPDINPGAPELCNGLDENCNDLIDENTTIYTYYLDTDNDNFGDINATLDTCQAFAPAGYVENSWDCDDTNENINPDILEACDGLDNDCSGIADDNITMFTYYVDMDNDTYGNPLLTFDTCASLAPIGYSSNNEDCDDNNSNIHPQAIEVCDGLDNNCSGFIDDGLASFTYYFDSDNDSYGSNASAIDTCLAFAPTGYVETGGDCDDNDADINPGADEACDGIDNNCNNLIDDGLDIFVYYFDADQDGYGDPQDSIETCENNPPEDYVGNNLDCDDFNNTINPDGEEIPNNGIDEDCVDGDEIVGVENTFDEGMEVYPNPFMDHLTIRSNFQGELLIQILDSNGKLISRTNLMFLNETEEIDLGNMASGIYFVMISNAKGDKRFYQKVIKQK